MVVVAQLLREPAASWSRSGRAASSNPNLKQNGVAICYDKKYKKGRTLQPLIAVLCSRICSKNAQTNSSCACLIRLAALCACCRPLGANGGSQGRAASWTHWAPCPALREAGLLRKESMMLRLFMAISMVCKKPRETKMRFKYSKICCKKTSTEPTAQKVGGSRVWINKSTHPRYPTVSFF